MTSTEKRAAFLVGEGTLMAHEPAYVRVDRSWLSTHAELGTRIESAVAKRRAKGLSCAANAVSSLTKLSGLMEEVGEVARVFQDGESSGRLRDELFDVAVLATLWASSIDIDRSA